MLFPQMKHSSPSTSSTDSFSTVVIVWLSVPATDSGGVDNPGGFFGVLLLPADSFCTGGLLLRSVGIRNGLRREIIPGCDRPRLPLEGLPRLDPRDGLSLGGRITDGDEVVSRTLSAIQKSFKLFNGVCKPEQKIFLLNVLKWLVGRIWNQSFSRGQTMVLMKIWRSQRSECWKRLFAGRNCLVQ